MSIAKVGSASGAADYYTKDNYYTGSEHEAESTWAGRGAEALGLLAAGSDVAKIYQNPQAVTSGAFESVLVGRPTREAQVGRLDKDGQWRHQAGFDLTFLAPKSVSILALIGGDTRLVQAHREAVAETMQMVERKYLAVQENPKHGEKGSRLTQNGVFALFTHDLSRAQDVLLHTHAIVANMTHDPLKGKWRAIDGQRLYDNRRVISNVYDAVLRDKVQRLGYKTQMKGRYGAFDIPLPKHVLDAQSKRRADIVAAFGDRYHTADWNTRQEVARATRAAKCNPDRDALRAQHKAELGALGFDAGEFIKAQSRHRYRPMRRRDLRRTVDRHIADITERQTTFTADEVLLSISMDPKAKMSVRSLEAVLADRVRRGELLMHSVNAKGEVRMTTAQVVRQEAMLARQVSEAGSSAPIVSDAHRLKTALDGLDPARTNRGQRAMIDHVLSSRSRYVGVQGYAGTGKTSSLRAAVTIANALADDAGHSFFAMAPTHNALGELAKATQSEGMVIQQFVSDYRRLLEPKAKASSEQTHSWAGRTLIIDEASLISYDLGEQIGVLVEKLEIEKVVLVGDRHQIASVQRGGWFGLLQDRGLPVSELRDVVRQLPVRDTKPELLEAAQAIAAGDTLGALYKLEGHITEVRPPRGKDVAAQTDNASGRDFVQQAAEEAYRLKSQGKDTILYAPSNALRASLNDNYRELLKADGRVSESSEMTAHSPLFTSAAMMGTSSSYRRGDVLHFTKATARGVFEKDSTWTVININHDKNVLTIVPSGATQNEFKDTKQHWKLRDLKAFPFAHLTLRSMPVGVGDQMVFNSRNAQQGIERGVETVVTQITDTTLTLSRPMTNEEKQSEGRERLEASNWTVRQSGERMLAERTFDRSDVHARLLQHAYALTTYKVQGQSRENAVTATAAQSDSVNRNVMGVGLTRETHNIRVYTNDLKQLQQNAVRRDETNTQVTDATGTALGFAYDAGKSLEDIGREHTETLAQAMMLRDAARVEKLESTGGSPAHDKVPDPVDTGLDEKIHIGGLDAFEPDGEAMATLWDDMDGIADTQIDSVEPWMEDLQRSVEEISDSGVDTADDVFRGHGGAPDRQAAR